MDSFFLAIAGGLLVLSGQFWDRNSKRKGEVESNLLEIYAYCRKLEAEMKNNYRELALAKTHAAYWWYCYQISSNHKLGAKSYDEHLRSQAYAREIEKRIGDTKADFIGHVRKFQAIRPLAQEIEKKLGAISDLTNVKAKYYDSSIEHQKLRYEIIEKDEKELREKYYSNLMHFEIIVDYLKSQLKFNLN